MNQCFWCGVYQHLPEYLNPTALRIGFFELRWYSIMYIIAFTVVYLLIRYRIKEMGSEKKSQFPISNFQTNSKSQIPISKIENKKSEKIPAVIKNDNLITDLFFYVILGTLLGGRLGYALFYNPAYYFAHPLEIISPFGAGGAYLGIYGMSYHGGLIGILLAGGYVARKYKVKFSELADFVIPAIPAGYFFGRLGNFLGGELYGRITQKPWGMYFSGDYPPALRHPSQLYEAFLEGMILFFILWPLRNNPKLKGYFLPLYLAGYGLARIMSEFFREPDAQVGLLFRYFTEGQLLSLLMVAAAGWIFCRQKKL